jgi:TolB-like protein/Tfp pilus assembly protein PilF
VGAAREHESGTGATTDRIKSNVTPVEKPSIAILRFSNLSDDLEQDYFAAGITEDIATAISRMHKYLAVSRHLSRRDEQADIAALARASGICYLLEGSVRKAGRRVRVAAWLTETTSGRQVWAERYDRDVVDIFTVQDEITEKVVTAIEPRIYAAEGVRAKRKPPESLDAWECVVRALCLINSRLKPDIAMARILLEKAVALDPGYPQALSLLSFITTLAVHLGWEPRGAALHLASETALHALRLDRDEPWAHIAMGYALAWSRRPDEAICEYEKALSLNPNLAIAHWLLALALCYLGRGEEALEHGAKAERLSPRDLLILANSGVANNVRAAACFVIERYAEGIEFARKAIAESPNLTPAYRSLILNCALAGEINQARAALRALKVLVPDISLNWVRETTPFMREYDQRRWVEAFRLAGLG